ncbi:putative RNA methyltransferase [Lineolata rhizophorae]|uniref:Putative RNA methyltransferase n=1 Tax=Lineolata rhizophorae TaxID=578093 RepID=A0A6A6P882_9PEZI|nr:putative RNA methyltransferase [Lineolata rhizophorae]
MADYQHLKKRRRVEVHQQRHDGAKDTSKPTATFKPYPGGRGYTLSIAVPGSIIANALTHDIKSRLAAQVARAAAVFCVDEIVIFDDGWSHDHNPNLNFTNSRRDRNSTASARTNGHSHGRHNEKTAAEDDDFKAQHTGWVDPCHFLDHLLRYIETPPHLRRALFRLHPNLNGAGALPSLDMPHHAKRAEWCEYREGVAMGPASGGDAQEEPAKKKKRKDKETKKEDEAQQNTLVDVGFPSPVLVSGRFEPDTRLTLRFETGKTPPRDVRWPFPAPSSNGRRQPDQKYSCLPVDEPLPLIVEAVEKDEPRQKGGYYWGYSTRRASSLSAVFTECNYADGYDLCIGTSERGEPVSDVLDRRIGARGKPFKHAPTQPWNHMLVVFGGVAGLEVAASSDSELVDMGIKEVRGLFDEWVDLCPGQGSRTIRTEEAVWVGLMGLREMVLWRAGQGKRVCE